MSYEDKRTQSLTRRSFFGLGLFKPKASAEKLAVEDKRLGVANAGERLGVATMLPSYSLGGTENFMEFKKDWTHQIVLYGASSEETSAFVTHLNLSLSGTSIASSASYQEAMDELLNELAFTHLPGHEFWSPAFRVHELKSSLISAFTKPHMRTVIERALERPRVVEIGYRSLRPDWRGELTPQIHVHRVWVHRMDETGFVASHARGVRRYSFENLDWAMTELQTDTKPHYEPVIELELYPSKAGQRYSLKVGTTRELFLTSVRNPDAKRSTTA